MTLEETFASLSQDLIHPEGPRISTMRNYRFAIVQYKPEEEFALRSKLQHLSSQLQQAGWFVLSISLQKLLLARLQAEGQRWYTRICEAERRYSPERALAYLRDKITPILEGPEGIAADCARIIQAHVAQHPDTIDRSLVLLGRTGALYPFFRSSALVRHLDGNTHNIPVVLLYPGTRQGLTNLSFMGIQPTDSDYRPRIY